MDTDVERRSAVDEVQCIAMRLCCQSCDAGRLVVVALGVGAILVHRNAQTGPALIVCEDKDEIRVRLVRSLPTETLRRETSATSNQYQGGYPSGKIRLWNHFIALLRWFLLFFFALRKRSTDSGSNSGTGSSDNRHMVIEFHRVIEFQGSFFIQRALNAACILPRKTLVTMRWPVLTLRYIVSVRRAI